MRRRRIRDLSEIWTACSVVVEAEDSSRAFAFFVFPFVNCGGSNVHIAPSSVRDFTIRIVKLASQSDLSSKWWQVRIFFLDFSLPQWLPSPSSSVMFSFLWFSLSFWYERFFCEILKVIFLLVFVTSSPNSWSMVCEGEDWKVERVQWRMREDGGIGKKRKGENSR